jgi:hypothetical protein
MQLAAAMLRESLTVLMLVSFCAGALTRDPTQSSMLSSVLASLKAGWSGLKVEDMVFLTL